MSELDLRSAPGDRPAPVRDDRGLLRAIARLAGLAAATACDSEQLLRELCVAAGHVMAVDGIGVMQTVPDRTVVGYLRVADADPAVLELERLQEALQRGPCRDSVEAADVVVVDDARHAAGRYGHFAVRMVDTGLRSMVAVPLLSRGRTWGVLDLYREGARAWSSADIDAARLLADVATSYLVLASERDDARAAQREVEHRSLHDSLTGLPNRVLLHDRIAHAAATAQRHGTTVGVAFVDLDRFKVINDSLGHAAGDEVLVEVARRLGSTIRAEDSLARLAGDEFVVLWADLPGDPSERWEVVASLTARLRDALRRPVPAAGEAVVVTASIGVTVSVAGQVTTAEQLVHEADLAMYVAKEDRDGVVVQDVVRP
jgi:diguanylate cyclase (GGDEF)-like protein